MNDDETGRNATAIGIWENEGGSLARDSMDHHYGRRIEPDSSWTVYHVYTGVPALAEGEAMTGLSRSDATEGMLSLNLRNAGRRKQRTKLSALARKKSETEKYPS